MPQETGDGVAGPPAKEPSLAGHHRHGRASGQQERPVVLELRVTRTLRLEVIPLRICEANAEAPRSKDLNGLSQEPA